MHQELPAYDLGFDIAQSEAMHRVNGVDQNGPAFAAGLRDGQPLTGFSFYKDNPDNMVRFKFTKMEKTDRSPITRAERHSSSGNIALTKTYPARRCIEHIRNRARYFS
jgi:hypothetical protein